MFSIDSGTGAPGPATTVAPGQFPADVATASSGRGRVYAACYGENRIRQYGADSTTGILTAIGTFNASSSSVMTIMADTKGRYLYMTSSGNNTVRLLTIDSATGTLSITDSYSGLAGVRGLWLVYGQ